MPFQFVETKLITSSYDEYDNDYHVIGWNKQYENHIKSLVILDSLQN